MTIAEFNYIESMLWFAMALTLIINLLLKGHKDAYFTVSIIASLAFIAFGISDIIEASTGAWWRPFSLLALKAVCVVSFIGCFVKYRKIKSAIHTDQ
ncbi:hypothetical protein N483_18100 [Pseudoalteromonas luteoviolacea NCIMB 1944]|uniref:Uncharacterized protein n=1 Tax=Pseudoalteromonas luteoviolacea (strain 2ta16) TaxID=1353533 RepID=V4H1Z2_PSEL2|nr:hypothetical protein PL2TA16_00250 [Pseudoalteromonas luteoviolacea 2ta16]KZN40101.1 hypothetical protein N483_18100 [Pseudoalteromonas luteoviolacea NCIMB 1944]